MNAGKTTMLLGSAHNYELKSKNILLLNSILDTRFGNNCIKSRTGISKPCNYYSTNDDIVTIIESKFPLDCVFIDEAQFLTEKQVKDLFKISSKHNLTIKCYGLRTDFKGNIFEGSRELLALADELFQLKTICDCGKNATMNRRLEESKNFETIQIGGEDIYTSECPTCWLNGRKNF